MHSTKSHKLLLEGTQLCLPYNYKRTNTTQKQVLRRRCVWTEPMAYTEVWLTGCLPRSLLKLGECAAVKREALQKGSTR